MQHLLRLCNAGESFRRWYSQLKEHSLPQMRWFVASLSVLHNTNNNDYLLNVAFLFRYASEEAALRRHYLKYELKHI
jgi:hypothetical protein